MEKVENLYRTARAQHAIPQRSDHVVESVQSKPLKPSRRGRRYRFLIASGRRMLFRS
jgi:hypothetical protein